MIPCHAWHDVNQKAFIFIVLRENLQIKVSSLVRIITASICLRLFHVRPIVLQFRRTESSRKFQSQVFKKTKLDLYASK